jgi:predicted transcriptional regulator
MTVTISFRVSEELEEYLEHRAKVQMTTKSTVAQMLLAEKVRNERRGSRANTAANNTEERSNNTEERSNNTEERSSNTEERASTELLGEAKKVKFPSMGAAEAFRSEYPQFVDSDNDDKRFKKVAVHENCPVKHLPNQGV